MTVKENKNLRLYKGAIVSLPPQNFVLDEEGEVGSLRIKSIKKAGK